MKMYCWNKAKNLTHITMGTAKLLRNLNLAVTLLNLFAFSFWFDDYKPLFLINGFLAFYTFSNVVIYHYVIYIKRQEDYNEKRKE